MIIHDRKPKFALGAFGYTAIDPNSLTLPSIPSVMGGIDIFSDDVYRISGDAGCPHSHREGSSDSFYGLWATLQALINSALGNVDPKDPAAASMVAAIKKYLSRLSAPIEASKSALKQMGDDQSKTLRAKSLCNCFAVMREAVSALPGIVQKAQAAIQARADAQAQAAVQTAQAQAAQQTAAAQDAAAQQATQTFTSTTQALQAQTQQLQTQTQTAAALVQATDAQKTAAIETGTHIFGVPLPWVLDALALSAIGGLGVWGYKKFKKRKSSAA